MLDNDTLKACFRGVLHLPNSGIFETLVLEATTPKQTDSEDRPRVFVFPLKGVLSYNWNTGLSVTTLPETNSEFTSENKQRAPNEQ